MCNLSEKVFSM